VFRNDKGEEKGNGYSKKYDQDGWPIIEFISELK
jgi:hypothetical protein